MSASKPAGESAGVKLKDTLNLPSTKFPMKASLPQAEPKQLAAWEEQRIYHQIMQERAGAPMYVLHDGPPYPTGEIHLGTGLNKILKDMVVKSKSMAGFRAPYVPGWDCHGLPIETKVEKELGGKGKVPPAEFRRRCREFATRFIDNHRREFKRLGIFGLWEDPYLTMSFPYEAAIADAFVSFLDKGYVYRGLKPVYWCIHDETALAEAEVEYEDHTSPSVWVKFPVVADSGNTKSAQALGAAVAAVIWTTTPWTLPHNRALAFHPDFAYVVLQTSHGNLLVAEAMAELLAKECHLEVRGRRGPWKGSALEAVEFQHPFINDRRVPAVLAEYVTLEQGSGIVHTAPGHGPEDFHTGQKYGLETAVPMDDQGRFTEGLPEYKGRNIFDANPYIVELLKSRGALLGEGKLRHSYPHCWRCHNPVIFRATQQWFIQLDTGEDESAGKPQAEYHTLRVRSLAEIKNVKWKPAWGEERMSKMIAERPDWCISRQRFWGVPLIVFRCAKCGELLRDVDALRYVTARFLNEGADAWFSHSAAELLPPGTACGRCLAADFEKGNDILDVWFDSGSSHAAVLENYGMPWPADCYLEGPDQYRGWFQSSLLVAMGLRDAPPFRQVVTHGWTLDDKGQPMSKSLGNAIIPAEVCEKWGADLLRVWVASQDYTSDVSLSEAMMGQIAETYRKVRNTLRFALSNLYDFDPDKDALPNDQLLEFDRYMLARTGELVAQCRAWYDTFDFHRVFHAVKDFCISDLSAFYFDVLKDRLYTSAKFGRARRSAQTTVYRIASAITRLLTPVMVFTAEEVWKFMPAAAAKRASVHMEVFPSAAEFDAGITDAQRADWETLLRVREAVLKALEGPRQQKLISSSLEARVVLVADGTTLDVLRRHQADLPALFIVSQVRVEEGTPPSDGPGVELGIGVGVQRADGTKCERCWNYSTRVGESAAWPTCCERCVAALEENARHAAQA